MSRQTAIQKLNDKVVQRAAALDRMDDIKLATEFREIVADFKQTFSAGLEIKNTDEILEQLAQIQTIHKSVSEFKEALESIEFPTYDKTVKVEGLDDLISKIPTEVKVEWIGAKELKDLIAKFEQISKDVSGALVSAPDQAPEKFTPMRRVRKVGNVLIYDDSTWSGASGGGGSSGSSTSTGLTDEQLRATAVPVSVSGVATSAKQDTQQTALDAIKSATEILDNIVSGSEAQVDVVTSAQPTQPTALIAFATDIPTAGTRVQLGSNVVVVGVVIQAKSTNTGVIYVGGSNVSSTVFGAELQPGQSVGLSIDNTNKVYVDTATNGNDVAVFGS